MYLLIGLGNPGLKYEDNRHNVGFMAIDSIIDRHFFDADKKDFKAIINTGTIDNKKVICVKPQTFMNDSGISVSQIVNFYKIPAENIFVLYDEMSLCVGKLRLSSSKGSAGHNGIRSISNHMNLVYNKVKIGVDHPGHKDLVTKHVLGNFSADEKIVIDRLNEEIANNISFLINGNGNEFMNKIAIVMNNYK